MLCVLQSSLNTVVYLEVAIPKTISWGTVNLGSFQLQLASRTNLRFMVSHLPLLTTYRMSCSNLVGLWSSVFGSRGSTSDLPPDREKKRETAGLIRSCEQTNEGQPVQILPFIHAVHMKACHLLPLLPHLFPESIIMSELTLVLFLPLWWKYNQVLVFGLDNCFAPILLNSFSM